MTRVVAVLETMWDWRQMTSGAGYREAPRYFRINPDNFSGRRLYRLVGPDARLLVTNACRELATSAKGHGTPDPVWLGENLHILDSPRAAFDNVPRAVALSAEAELVPRIDVLLVCGKVAQAAYKACGYVPAKAGVIEMPHPAARAVWTRAFIDETVARIAQQRSAA